MELANLQLTLVTLTLASCFLIVGGRRLDSVIKGAATQAVVLAVVTGLRGYSTGVHEMYVAAVLTLLIKGGAIPFILYKVVAKVGSERGIKSYVSIKMSFVICCALVIVAFWVSGETLGPAAGIAGRTVPVAIAMMLIGLYLMITRKLAVNQVVGLLIMENGIFLAGVGTTNGMPAVVELGIFLDVVVGVLIMGILVFRINRAFDTINTENLRNLRG